VAALCASAGCGSSGDICDVDFGTIAGTYTFSLTTHDERWVNSCFDTVDPDATEPADKVGCEWSLDQDEDSLTIELVIEEDGDVGSARVSDISGDADDELDDFELDCEMLEGEVCDAPIRCHIGNQGGCSIEGSADDWTYACGCSVGGVHDTSSAECQACKTQYDQYAAERTGFCDKGREGDYFEFTISVKD
jgi:hypothetical protein